MALNRPLSSPLTDSVFINSENLPIHTEIESEFSWSLWINVTLNILFLNPMEHWNVGSSGNRRGIFHHSAARVQFNIPQTGSTGQAISQTGLISINTWHHIVAIYKQGSLPQIHLNGAEVSYFFRTAGTGSLLAASGQFSIFRSGVSNFFGQITEVGYWNRVLTTDEIALLSDTSGPYSPILISDGLVGAWRLYGATDGAYQPDYINNQTLTVSSAEIVESANPYTFKTRIETDPVPSRQLGSSAPSYERGKIIAQTTTLDSEKTIGKSSIYLNVNNDDRSDYILEENGVVSWSGLNFQEISDQHEWTIYTTVSEYTGADDLSVNQGFLTNANSLTYTTKEEVYLSAPNLRYTLFLGTGVYDIFVRAAGSGTFWYTWDDDQEPDVFTLSDDNLIWRKIGNLQLDEPEIRNFYLYLGSAAAQTIKIDQFRMINLDTNTLTNTAIAGQHITYPITKGPFNTFARIKPLTANGQIDTTGSTIGWGWLPSDKIRSTGWHHYKINDIKVTGLSLEYVVISGNKDFNAQWNYTPSDSSNNTYTSTNYGSSFSQDD